MSTVLGFCAKGLLCLTHIFHGSTTEFVVLTSSWSRSLTATPSRTWPFVRVPTDAGKSWKMTVMESQGKVEFHQCVMEFLTATAVNDGRLDVYRATVEGKLLYAAWSGFCSAGDRVRLNSYSY